MSAGVGENWPGLTFEIDLVFVAGIEEGLGALGGTGRPLTRWWDGLLISPT